MRTYNIEPSMQKTEARKDTLSYLVNANKNTVLYRLSTENLATNKPRRLYRYCTCTLQELEIQHLGAMTVTHH